MLEVKKASCVAKIGVLLSYWLKLEENVIFKISHQSQLTCGFLQAKLTFRSKDTYSPTSESGVDSNDSLGSLIDVDAMSDAPAPLILLEEDDYELTD